MARTKRKRDSKAPIHSGMYAEDVNLPDPYRIHTKPCKPADHLHRKRNQKTPSVLRNCHDNPNCLYGLGEHSSKGIWNHKALIVRLLGEDPREYNRLRQENEQLAPCGLRNLGATCYLNSMLQCLFMNMAFREAVFAWEPKDNVPVAMKNQMYALQRIFASMQLGNKSVVDPQEFASTLALNEVLQQDAQEFSKLLLTHLRTIFSHSRLPQHVDLVDRLFQGKLNYVTKCLRCKQASHRPSSYYEISLHIKGNKRVDQCILQHLAAEVLEGDNKYFCDHCQSKERAERFIALEPASLPPTLTVQLMRFVYDPTANAKKKLMDIIEINETLNMTQLLRQSGRPDAFTQQEDVVYRLVAYLNHRGKSAHVGHYTASVAYPSTETTNWFEFDDSVVHNMQSLENMAEGTEERGVANKPRKSRDAYMLLYVRQDHLDAQLQRRSEPMPSAELRERIECENQVQTIDADEYGVRASALEQRIQERRDAYAKYFEKESPSPKPSASDFYWIDADWLRAWITGEHVKDKKEKKDKGDPVEETTAIRSIPFHEPMQLSKFCCEHATDRRFCFAPDRVGQLKRISKALFSYLQQTTGVASVVFSADSFRCLVCEAASRSQMVEDVERRHEVELELELLKHSNEPIDDGYLMSRAWIASYKTRLQKLAKQLGHKANGHKKPKTSSTKTITEAFAPDAEDTWQQPLNADLLCVHGNLTLDKKKFRVVPITVWSHFAHKCDVAAAFSHASVKPCAQCQVDQAMSNQVMEEERASRDEILTRSPLKRLYRRKLNSETTSLTLSLVLCDLLDQHQRAFLVPAKWMMQWRNYIRDLDVASPPLLTCAELVCRHEKLVLPPSFASAIKNNARSGMTTSWSDEVELVQADEMKHLGELYGVPNTHYYYVTRDPLNQALRWHACSLVSILGQSSGTDQDQILCHECEAASAQQHLESLINFQNRFVFVQLLAENQAVPSTETLASTETTPGRRRSRRRNGSSSSQACWPIVANADDSVLVLKHKIYEEIDAVPIRQRLYFRGNVLEDGMVLRECGIKAGDAIFMRLSEELPEELVMNDQGQEREVGFEDSVFLNHSASSSSTHSVWVCVACTYVNEDQDHGCEMCGTDKVIEIK